MVKIVYEVEDDGEGEFFVTQNITIKANEDFSGTHLKIKIEEDFLIVTNSDGERTGVYFYDHEWNEIEYFPL